MSMKHCHAPLMLQALRCVWPSHWHLDLSRVSLGCHMQRQETEKPRSGSGLTLKPIKATWVCSHAWLQRWPGGVCMCVCGGLDMARRCRLLNKISRLSHMLHNALGLSRNLICGLLVSVEEHIEDNATFPLNGCPCRSAT